VALAEAIKNSDVNASAEIGHDLDPLELEELDAIKAAEAGHPEHLCELLQLKNYSPSAWAKAIIVRSLRGEFKKKRGPKKPRLSRRTVAFLIAYAQIIDGFKITNAVDVTANSLKVQTRVIWRKLKDCGVRDLEDVLKLIKQSAKQDLLALRDELIENVGKPSAVDLD